MADGYFSDELISNNATQNPIINKKLQNQQLKNEFDERSNLLDSDNSSLHDTFASSSSSNSIAQTADRNSCTNINTSFSISEDNSENSNFESDNSFVAASDNSPRQVNLVSSTNLNKENTTVTDVNTPSSHSFQDTRTASIIDTLPQQDTFSNTIHDSKKSLDSVDDTTPTLPQQDTFSNTIHDPKKSLDSVDDTTPTLPQQDTFSNTTHEPDNSINAVNDNSHLLAAKFTAGNLIIDAPTRPILEQTPLKQNIIDKNNTLTDVSLRFDRAVGSAIVVDDNLFCPLQHTPLNTTLEPDYPSVFDDDTATRRTHSSMSDSEIMNRSKLELPLNKLYKNTNLDEALQSLAAKYRDKYIQCSTYLNELKQVFTKLNEDESQLLENVELNYDKEIMRIRQQKEDCIKVISEDYCKRRDIITEAINNVRTIETQLKQLIIMSATDADYVSDCSSVASVSFSESESVCSEIPTSPTSPPHRVQVNINEYNIPSLVFGKQGTNTKEFRNLRGIATDYENRIYIVDCGNKRIQVFNNKCDYVSNFGSKGNENGQFLFPVGIAIFDQTLFVTDSERHNLQSFSLAGKFIDKVGSKGSSNLQLNYPNGLDISSEGKIYIADSINNRVMVFNSNLRFKNRFGNRLLKQPNDISISDLCEVYVSDRSDTACIYVFKLNGTLIRNFGNNMNIGFIYALSTEGVVVVSECNSHSIKFIGAQKGEIIRTIGNRGSEDGMFIRPQGIVFDYNSRLIVCDSVNNRIQVF